MSRGHSSLPLPPQAPVEPCCDPTQGSGGTCPSLPSCPALWLQLLDCFREPSATPVQNLTTRQQLCYNFSSKAALALPQSILINLCVCEHISSFVQPGIEQCHLEVGARGLWLSDLFSQGWETRGEILGCQEWMFNFWGWSNFSAMTSSVKNIECGGKSFLTDFLCPGGCRFVSHVVTLFFLGPLSSGRCDMAALQWRLAE